MDDAAKDALLHYQRQVAAEETRQKLARDYYELSRVPTVDMIAPGSSTIKQYASSSSSGASSSGGGYISQSSHSSRIDVGDLIKQAIEEASAEFKLTVETMQEQIDELWEYIKELEDDADSGYHL